MRRWSCEEDTRLRGAAQDGPIAPAVLLALAGELGRSVGAVRVRASQLQLLTTKPRRPRPAIPPPERIEHEVPPIVDAGRFAQALSRAVAAGLVGARKRKPPSHKGVTEGFRMPESRLQSATLAPTGALGFSRQWRARCHGLRIIGRWHDTLRPWSSLAPVA